MNLHNIILKEVQYNLNLIINEHDIDSNLKSPIIIQSTLNHDEKAELLRLRKEIKQLRMEQEILKKASAYFARHVK